MISEFKGKYSFLSNFFEHPVVYGSLVYPSNEHAFQAAKVNDLVMKMKIRDAKTPGQAKRLGRQVVMRADWEDVKIRVMMDLCLQKFSDHTLRLWLKATAPDELIDGNNWGDCFWGVCGGVGQNHLGKILMWVRDEA